MTEDVRIKLDATLTPLTIVEVETNRSLTFEGDFQVKPLGEKELENFSSLKPLRIPVHVLNARVFDSGINDYIEDLSNFSTELDSPLTSRVVSLVPGGWLPSLLGARGRIVMPDRNVIRHIKKNQNSEASDFIDFFRKFPVCINPAIIALEGNERKPQTPGMIRHQLQEVIAKFKKALPNAFIFEGIEEGIIGIASDIAVATQKQMQFLKEVGTRITSPVRKDRQTECIQSVLASADRYQVDRCSLPVLFTISAVTNPQAFNPCFKLLKFRRGYGPGEAYNALADIGALELLAAGNEKFPNIPTTYCTADIDLVRVWVGAQAFIYGRDSPFSGLLFRGIEEQQVRSLLNS